jgi:hypothetical protein
VPICSETGADRAFSTLGGSGRSCPSGGRGTRCAVRAPQSRCRGDTAARSIGCLVSVGHVAAQTASAGPCAGERRPPAKLTERRGLRPRRLPQPTVPAVTRGKHHRALPGSGRPMTGDRRADREAGDRGHVQHDVDLLLWAARRQAVGLWRRKQLRLTFESGALGVRCHCLWQDLERNLPFQACVSCPVDLAHAPSAEQGVDLVDAEASARGQGHQF